MSSAHPHDAPPSYESAIGSSSAPQQGIRRVPTDGPGARRARNGISPEARRSMEDLARPLPDGWVRSFDPEEQHQFFVDTKADPPRSIWTHPYDDEEYLSSLSPEERKEHSSLHRTMSIDDIAAESSDDDDDHRGGPSQTSQQRRAGPGSTPGALPDRGEPAPKGLHKFTRRMKDKITSTTHEERQVQRAQREEEERRAYQQHLKMRQAMIRAMQTGEPQFLGKDSRGRDVYLEPAARGGYPGRYANGGYGYSPFSSGLYASPNTRYMRPGMPYGRPYGYGYGGGMGMGAPLAAGILGGSLMGGLMF
ncbi:unnamed protein product [Periconia digitata]|uniref:WW domain-containing protein n=1 Tax=Periconia digitata TaxID=1303443 RepID=A0A9W4UH19_9PLEO|nr:unnamed protein product [Periconia digitata]